MIKLNHKSIKQFVARCVFRDSNKLHMHKNVQISKGSID